MSNIVAFPKRSTRFKSGPPSASSVSQGWRLTANLDGNSNPYTLRREIVSFTRRHVWLHAFKVVNGLAPPAALIVDSGHPGSRDMSDYRWWQQRAAREAAASISPGSAALIGGR
jgi:hypothetical protein